ncbi:MAG: LysR family transcriptional regulator [Phycisphaerales bacterium]|nr:MAG: LysR family transcriptional regulator [Phycisphaerales bacterium]
MELHQLRYFVTLAETSNFSRAAKQCGIAQPSLSQQIRRLEDSLGTPLFDRLGRSIAMTEAGEALLPRARRILSEVNDAAHEIRAEPARRELRLGAIPTMAPYLLPPLLKQFRREQPNCELTVREDLTARLVDAVIDCELDCAIMSTPVDDPLIELEVIATEPLLAALPRDFPLPEPRRLCMNDLRDQPTVVLHEMHCLGRQIEDFCSQSRLTRRIVCRGTQLMTILELVALGLGVSIVPEMCAKADRSKARQYMPITGSQPERDIAIAWRRGRTRPTLARSFIDLLQTSLKST